MLKKIKYFFIFHFVLPLLYQLIRGYSWTFRLKIENENEWFQFFSEGGIVVIAIWHQQFFSIIRYFQKYREYKPCIMISQSKDGDIISNIASRTGWTPVRGSSSSGGIGALKNIIKTLRHSRIAVHVIDGPKGPIGKIKPGLIHLARTSNAAIVPLSVSSDRAWFFNSWDKFMLPKPFAKVILKFGKPIKIDRDEDDIDNQVNLIEKIMQPDLHL